MSVLDAELKSPKQVNELTTEEEGSKKGQELVYETKSAAEEKK